MRFVTYNQLFDMLGPTLDFDGAVRRFNRKENGSGGSFPVHMDLLKEKDSFKIIAELPGMEKDKIKISVEENVLNISGERKRGELKDNELIRSERFHGSFSRSFRLPENIDKSGISADYKNGLLEVILPLKPEEKPKQIEVQVS